MASVRVFFLLATLAIAAANPSAGYAGDQPEKKPYLMPKSEAKPKTDEHDTTNPSCGGCQDAKVSVRDARSGCCKEASKKAECLCPTMNTLISAGVPLKEVCFDDMACKESQYNNTGSPVLIDRSKKCEVPGVCNAVVEALRELAKCFSAKPAENKSGGNCFAKSLTELGFENPKVIEKILQSKHQ